jgi:RNA polymerase sigma-70 factor (ECF subfamily)
VAAGHRPPGAGQPGPQTRWARLLRRAATQADDAEPAHTEPAHAGLHRSDADDELTSALAQLSDGDRELLRLAYWDDLSRQDLATVLGISVGAVDTRLHRARQRLRAHLAETSAAHVPTEEKNHAER